MIPPKGFRFVSAHQAEFAIATLRAPAIGKRGPGRRNGLLKPNKETVRKEESGPCPKSRPRLAVPHIRMGPSKKKEQEKEDAMTSDAVA